MQGQRHRSCQTSCYCTHACSLLPRISRRWLLNRCEQSYSTVPESGDSTNTAYPLPYDVPKLPTHGTASWCATATEGTATATLRFGWLGVAFLLFSPFPLLPPGAVLLLQRAKFPRPLAVQIAEQSSLPLDALEILPLHLSAFYASLHINYASSAHLYGLPRIPDEFAAPSCRALTTAVAPSNRIGPIACQASSFASARSLRRHCRADRFFHELSKIATLLWRCQSQHLVNDRRYCATS
ncbi:hypothetical protein TgHK011_009408 [Trichoderma gracile]|nr:hypothetical protein TgHK011_009408 [Trichoderma gracile]